MPTTTETDPSRRATTPGAAALALLATLWLVGGCDGGIFGTGDGPSADVEIDAAPESADSAVPMGEEGAGQGTPPTTDADDADSDVEMLTLPEPVPPIGTALVNTLVADPAADAPRVRIVNAGSADVALAGEGNAAVRLFVPTVAPGTASAYVPVSDGTSSLMLGYPSTAPGDETLEGSLRLGPLYLLDESVTTLLVRDDQLPGVTNVVDLPTLIASADPGLALVRLLPGSGVGPDDGPLPAASYTLVPAEGSANPGGVDVALGDVALGGPVNADYATVPAGDYRLESSSGAAGPDTVLSFAGGSVRTLVLLDSGELLVVEDGG